MCKCKDRKVKIQMPIETITYTIVTDEELTDPVLLTYNGSIAKDTYLIGPVTNFKYLLLAGTNSVQAERIDAMSLIRLIQRNKVLYSFSELPKPMGIKRKKVTKDIVEEVTPQLEEVNE